MTQPGPRPIALITGAARRIGRAIALSLADGGYDIAVHYHRSEAEAAALVREIEAKGRRSVALASNLADASQVARLVPQMMEQLGPPTCLINNASQFEHDTLATLTPEIWGRHQDINLRAPVM